MKRIVFYLIAAIFFTGVIQGQEQENKTIVETFVKDYNTSKYDDFYNCFSTSLKEELSIDQAKKFFVEMKEKMGNIIHIEYYGLDDNQLALYKTEFENKETILVNLAINNEGELVGFRIIEMPKQDRVKESLVAKSIQDIILETAKGLPYKGQFSIALINDDKIDYFGVENKKGKLVLKDNKESLFSMANFATIYTSTLFAKAVNEGKLKLTQDANESYDFAFRNDIKLPLTKLANHSAFVPMLPPLENLALDDDEFFSDFDENQLYSYLKNQLTIDSLSVKNKQSFSFLGYAILGDVVTKALNSDYNTLVNESIFKPYGMNHSLVEFDKKNKKIIKGIDRLGKEAKIVPVNVFKYATSTYSSAIDISKFVQAQFVESNKDLTLTHLPSAIVSPRYWLSSGWKIAFPNISEDKLYFSRAIDSGYSNYVGFDPINKKGLVILANSSTEESLKSLDELSYQLMIKMFNKQ